MYCYKTIDGKKIRNPLYAVWMSMKQRCNNPNTQYYKHYGGRGISVCDEWMNSPIAFMAWAENNGWVKGLQLDRINNNEGYSPDNCRFVTRNVSMRNTRRTKFYLYRGELKTLPEWAEILNANYYTLKNRIAYGWDLENAYKIPIGERLKRLS